MSRWLVGMGLTAGLAVTAATQALAVGAPELLEALTPI